jgi:hypothetical protein
MKRIVSPVVQSQAEGYRCGSFKATGRDPSTALGMTKLGVH